MYILPLFIIFKLFYCDNLDNLSFFMKQKCGFEIDIKKEHDNIHLLILAGFQLSSLPSELYLFKYLQTLNLQGNKLKSLPNTFSKIKTLEKLNLSNNKFTKIPKEILSLEKLNLLILSNNYIEGIPSEINNLLNLEIFEIENNNLMISETFHLPKVVQLFISKNFQNVTYPRNFKTDKNSNFNRSENCKRFQKILVGQDALKFLQMNNSGITNNNIFLGNIVTLEELHLRNNNLSTFPIEFINLKNLTLLDLSDNKISNVNKHILYLDSLLTLFLKNNALIEFVIDKGPVSSLQTLFLENNSIYNIYLDPVVFQKLTDLEISNNQITKLPSALGNFGKLKSIKASDNKIEKIPCSFKNLNELELLDLDNNYIKNIDVLFYLEKLRSLKLTGNQIQKFPIQKFKNIRCLFVHSSNIIISKENTLQKIIFVGCNNIADILYSCVNVENMSILNCNLKTISNNIIDLKRMKYLSIIGCGLKSINPKIFEINSLNDIDLSNNEIKKIPRKILNSNHNISSLDLSGNPIEIFSDQNNIGALDIKLLFKSIYIDEEIIENFDCMELHEIYKNLDFELKWNLKSILKNNKSTLKPMSLSKNEILKIWDSSFKDLIGKKEEEVLKNYIINTFEAEEMINDEKSLYSKEQIKHRMVLLENVIVRINSLESDMITAILHNLNDCINNCYDGQTATLMSIYVFLTNGISSSLESFIHNKINAHKEHSFLKATTSNNYNQNAHVYTFWRYMLKDELCFTSSIPDIFPDLKNPSFYKRCFVLYNFLRNFNVDCFIDNLVQCLNSDNQYFTDAVNLLNEKHNKNWENIKQYFEFNNEINKEHFFTSKIKKEGVIEILKILNILQ
ncbi:Leucine rich repeat protein [Spraguea lophii 42_110]|uniref:Leucine rich repeat protein n=1 Tax=Spraguea lophii (strain 42_110) TaxID=1358809 RepID=S7XLA5_SPRLO|nr:Leucine rich repeat protein [Spraguea lophii 42_110]